MGLLMSIIKRPPISICNNSANQNGSALIVTLLLITILVAIVVDFVYEVYIDSSALSNWGNAQKASLIARSGQTLSSRYLAELKKHTYTDLREVTLPIEKVFGTNTTLVVKIEDESAKFNINSIIYPNGLTNKKALLSLKKLFEYLNINPDLALIIADWIDPDSEPRMTDSENVSKNTFLWSIDELKLIEGINNDIFNKIKPYITVHSNNQININTAELPVLVSLSEDMTEDLAKRIIEYRKISPFESASHIVRVSGLEAIGIKILDRITAKSSYFRVTAVATVNGITRIIESVIDTSRKIHFWREG
jgi:general secretion pathway protein K